MTQTEPQFKVGDRCFSHYTMKWGTVIKVGNTDRDRYYRGTGKPEDRMDDTTWYDVRADDGSVDMLDDAHGHWDMARLVPPRIAKLYGYGDDPNPPQEDEPTPHVGHFSRLGGTWWCDTCNSPYCDEA